MLRNLPRASTVSKTLFCSKFRIFVGTFDLCAWCFRVSTILRRLWCVLFFQPIIIIFHNTLGYTVDLSSYCPPNYLVPCFLHLLSSLLRCFPFSINPFSIFLIISWREKRKWEGIWLFFKGLDSSIKKEMKFVYFQTLLKCFFFHEIIYELFWSSRWWKTQREFSIIIPCPVCGRRLCL